MQLNLKDMTLEQKLGFVMCARVVYGMPDPDFVLEMVRKRAVGCIQIPTQDREFVEKSFRYHPYMRRRLSLRRVANLLT